MNRTRVILIAVLVLGGIIGTALYLRLSTDPGPNRDRGKKPDQTLENARARLETSRDLMACRAAIELVNAHLNRTPTTLPSLTPEQRDALRQRASLSPQEIAELESTIFTKLDGHYLDLCFLLRDGALSLELNSRGGPALPPRTQAEAAFEWTVRQVQLLAPNDADARRRWSTPPDENVVTQFALRCGMGTPLTRCLVFLMLLQQLGQDGCLLALPGAQPRYWACGVLDGEQIYLFDPRLGLPLPSADGQGIATLAEMKKNPGAILSRLAINKDHPYDITPELVATSEVHLAPSLSALAPRMKWLQTEALGEAIRVQLAVDWEAQVERFARATGRPAADIKFAGWALRLAHGFFPESEGGVDTTDRQRRSRYSLAWPYINFLAGNVPESVRPRRLDEWDDLPLQPLFRQFSKPFIDFFLAPDQPREHILRGELSEALRELGTTREKLQDWKTSFENTYRPQEIEEWYRSASRIMAEQRRGSTDPAVQVAIEQHRKRYEKSVVLLVEGASALPRLIHVDLHRSLCKQEQAERLQFRLDHRAPANGGTPGPPPGEPSDAELNAASLQWKDTRTAWTEFLNTHSEFVVTNVRAVALGHRARAQEMLAVLARRKALNSPSDTSLKEEARRSAELAIQEWQDSAREGKDLPFHSLACVYQAQAIRDRLLSEK